MSTAFTAALPLIEELKSHLNKLKSVTDEIAKAKDSAQQNENVAKQSQASVAEVIGAAKRMVTAQEGLVERLSQQQQAGLGEQELLLRAHAEELSNKTSEQTARQLDGLKQAATSTQVLIDSLLQEHPQLLTAIWEQHLRGIDEQQETLKKGVQTWADSLHQQMQTELKLLRQVIETLQKNALQQHDELSSVANQLQVVAGRVTAFAEVMNAAKFTTRLESIEKHQQEVLNGISGGNTANAVAFANQEATHRKQVAELELALQHIQQEAVVSATQQQASTREALEKLDVAHQQRNEELQNSLLDMTLQLSQATKRQQILHLVVLGVVVTLGVLQFFINRL